MFCLSIACFEFEELYILVLMQSIEELFSFLKRLRILYTKILGSLQTMPQDAAYRKYTEQLISERFNHVKAVRHVKCSKRLRFRLALTVESLTVLICIHVIFVL